MRLPRRPPSRWPSLPLAGAPFVRFMRRPPDRRRVAFEAIAVVALFVVGFYVASFVGPHDTHRPRYYQKEFGPAVLAHGRVDSGDLSLGPLRGGEWQRRRRRGAPACKGITVPID